MGFELGMGGFTRFEQRIRCARIFKVEEKVQAVQSMKQIVAGQKKMHVKYTKNESYT